jgi:hybrid polyketide synthase/nonribosomal peptide synthetase ACE1
LTGGGTGGVTRAILKHLDNKYSSYTFTDISIAFFEQAQETFKDHRNIIYESLDIEKDPTTQGFQEHSYDLVIASNVLHATKFLDQTMTNVRKLLKPGGKLLILEAVDNGAIRVAFSFCGVPGWWAGVDDGRELSPLITLGQWNSLLLRNGFSGIDTITPGTESAYQPVAVFVSSAMDEQIGLLQKPLSFTGSKSKVDTVLLVGGKTDYTKQLVQGLELLLQPWADNILLADSLEDLDLTTTSSMLHVLNLTELDAPIFEDITSPRLEAFKSLLNISKSFLWVTSGSKFDKPYSSMVLGIGRTLVHEMPHLRLQVLDAAHTNELSARVLAEAFLRIILVETWKNDIYAPERLWSHEPELWLENGRFNITRVVPEKAANRRLMSSRRVIKEEIGIKRFGIDVTWSGEFYALNQRQCLEEFPGTKTDEVSVWVSHSTLSALRVQGAGYLYLVFGENYENGMKVLALSESNGSLITTPACWTLPWHVKEDEEALLLVAIANDLLAQVLIETTLDNSTLLLFEPELALADAVRRRASLKNIRPCLITTATETKAENWLHLHQFSSDQEIKAKVPKDISALVDFSCAGKSNDLVSRIGAMATPLCQKATSSLLFSRTSQCHPGINFHSVAESLRSAVANSVSIIYTMPYPNSPSAIPARELSEPTPMDLGLQIVDWTASPTVPVRVQSAESMVKFKSDKTYFLVGMAGDMGRSLCRWMILHGAKHVVLTSRNPVIEKSWLDDVQELGGMVKVMSM